MKPLVWAKAEYLDDAGRSVVELEGDFAALHPVDRPPRRIIQGVPAGPPRQYDRSPTRRPIRGGEGRPIEELRDREAASGACAVLHNGPSLAGLDLQTLRVPLLGMNRTVPGRAGYQGPRPEYYVYTDQNPWETSREVAAALEQGTLVVNGSSNPLDPFRAQGGSYRAVKCQRMHPFSLDLARDGYAPLVPCTSGFLALSLAIWLGFRRVYLLGLDLQGGHFDGTSASTNMPAAVEHYEKIALLLGKERPGLEVLVCASPASRVRAFPAAPFEALQAERRETS